MPPPTLEGYRHLDLLGSGGFSDVFLYEREFPRQKVAIKVLVSEAVDDEARRRFADEANLMASLSTHPYIVTIYEARLSDDGRPYLVMEYYPRPNLHLRARSERFTVPFVLRTGVQVAAAVESAHRIGVLHRDLKPANILTSEYGRPGVTDFGIAAAEGDARGAEGMSIPWSPPEILAGSEKGDGRSDVYSLGATLWTVLAGGRSPFEAAGESNRSIDLLDRIERGTVPSIDRPDVPGSLQRLLAQTMAKDPRRRPASAAELARALQVIEVEQRFDMTPFEVGEELPTVVSDGGPIDAEAGSTRVKDLGVIESQGPSAERTRHRSQSDRTFQPSHEAASKTSVPRPGRPTPGSRGPLPRAADLIASTPYVPTDSPPPVLGPASPPAAAGGAGAGGVDPPVPDRGAPAASGDEAPRIPAPETERSGPPLLVILGVLVGLLVVVLAAIVGYGLLDGSSTTTPAPTTTAPTTTVPPIPTVEDVTVEPIEVLPSEETTYRVTWTTPERFEEGDTYTLTGDAKAEERTATSFTFPSTKAPGLVCVTVKVVRDGVAGPSATNPGC